MNTIDNKKTYVKNDVMTTIIKRCGGEKTRGTRAIDGFRNKLMIPDSEISKCSEFEVKLKIRKILKNHKFIEEYSVRIHKIDPYFYKHNKKNTVDKNGCEYILFRIGL